MINATGSPMILEIARQTKLAKAIAQTQIEISTGKKIQQPSDDPAAAVRIASIRRSQADGEIWKRNIDLGSSLANQADGVLKTLNDRLARVQELAVQGASASLPVSDRNTIAAEIRSIAQEVDALRQTQSSLGEPLFSATQPRAIRFGDGVVFPPVPSQTDIFQLGGISFAQQIGTIADAVASGNRAQLDPALDAAEGLVQHGAEAAASVGNAAARLDRLASAHDSRTVDLSVERSGLEDTDLTTAIATLNAQQLTLEAAQSAFARINRRSLIDLLS